ncbi:399_t:CDS:10 [Ambispora gerdemannii]|uniref:399_t:CDS:1 n=1 Tax=Ambispora gerdemannii TaxID=144530 RepID=A0A9N8W956_9GLOM|nr:399_t:CDS:10 [Ambispora gerdemannii]
MASTINSQNKQETLYQKAYTGPHATFAKIFLRPGINFDYLEEVASDLLSSEKEYGEKYTIDTGFRIFLLFLNVSMAKLATRELSTIEKIIWVRTLLRVFEKQAFLGFVSVGGLLKGYQLHKANQQRRIFGELISEVEDVFMEGLDKILDQYCALDSSDDVTDTIAFLCGRCLSFIPTRRLRHLKQKANLLGIITIVIVSSPRTFQEGQFIGDITKEIESQQEIKWTKEFQSYKNLQTLSKQALFAEMGPISRAVGKLVKVIEREDLINPLYQINNFAHNLYLLWEKCPLSQVKEELMNDETKKATPLLWLVFKTILFTITMIFKAIVDNSLVKGGYCDTEGEKLDMLLTFSYTYFITIRFDLYGFSVYKEIFHTILNQLMETPSFCNEILNMLKHIEVNNPMAENRIIFYFLVAEQIMKVLEDSIVERELLPTLCLYLTDNSNLYLFESAHSTVLAIYITQKSISKDFSSYYSNLLLEGYPAYLSIEQLRAAYTTMIKSLSETDDALVWYCLENLLDKIESLPTSSNLELSEQQSTTTETNNNETRENPESDSSSINLNVSEKDVVSTALYLQRGHLLLTLIDQVGTVNLIFLETLLSKIKSLISLESNGIAKSALQKALFDVLSKNLDYTKKDAGVKWWLNEGREITNEIQA